MKTMFCIIALAALFAGCKTKSPQQQTTANMENPLLVAYDNSFGAPPFETIKPEHYRPAIEEAIRLHQAEIDSLANNQQPASFANTIEALSYSGDLLTRVVLVFSNMNNAMSTPELQKIDEETAPLLASHIDNIVLNDKLFERIKAVHAQKDSLTLTTEQKRLLDDTYSGFVRGGALLNEQDKNTLRKINEQLSVLTVKFQNNLMSETNDYQMIIENKADLSGLPDDIIQAAAERAKSAGMDGKWLFTLQGTSVFPFLTYSDKRELREKLYTAYTNRGNNGNEKDNKDIIVQLTKLRYQRARLLGYATHADYVLEKTMAAKPANAYSMLEKLWNPALKNAKAEAAELQKLIEREGNTFKLEGWDWWYYAEKLRKEKYDLSEEELRPYFEVSQVREGAFMLANKLYGTQFKPIANIPRYHEEVTAFEVLDESGVRLGVLYLDFFPRSGKMSGAWMTSFNEQYIKDGKNVRPVVSLVMNFTKPTADKPSLLTFEEVSTFFHEFGHALHGLLTNCTYPTLSGTNVSRDFVELPSQIMENWVSEPEMLRILGKHYQTGEVIPDELIDKIRRSQLFNQGFATAEYLAASLLDLDWHTITDTSKLDVLAFEQESMRRIGLIGQIAPRYRSTYFAHIFTTGYDAGYYSYIWAEVLDADAFGAFLEKGLFDRETATAFKVNILEKGGTEDPMVLYRNFRGKDPDIKALLKKRGLS